MTLDAAVLQKALNHSISERGEGAWLQVAGITFDADLKTGEAQNVLINGKALQKDEKFIGVMPRYIVDLATDKESDHDGYDFDGNDGDNLDTKFKAIVINALTNAPEVNGVRTISPPDDDRITLLLDPDEEKRKAAAKTCSAP